MASQHLDKLVKSFIEGSNPHVSFNKFADLQDPTYLSFKIDFFPDLGISFPDDAYSSGGLFRQSTQMGLTDYGFYDSAADYLARIGAPARQQYLEAFMTLLYDLQEKAPWYFQSISGLGDLYKIDPAINYRGKDKILTIECLESIDLRMSLLADLYRNLAFDTQSMKEVLPINLRTFNMNIHVLEFRRFNTTYGIIADHFGDNERPVKGQDRQQSVLDSQRKNVFSNSSSSLFSGLTDNVTNRASDMNSRYGGVFGNNSSDDSAMNLKSAFEAISIQTFMLKDCEFDFYSESPGYLETVSVKDIPEASNRFKIKVGKIQKTSFYPFDNYVISEYAKYSKLDPNNIHPIFARNLKTSAPYFEQTNISTVDNPKDLYRNIRESIFPTDGNPLTAQADNYKKTSSESDNLRQKPLERMLGGLLKNASGFANEAINKAAGEATDGVFGKPSLGNVYGDASFAKKASEALSDFLTPGNQLTTTSQTLNSIKNNVYGKGSAAAK